MQLGTLVGCVEIGERISRGICKYGVEKYVFVCVYCTKIGSNKVCYANGIVPKFY